MDIVNAADPTENTLQNSVVTRLIIALETGRGYFFMRGHKDQDSE